jgi:hypothetical protein
MKKLWGYIAGAFALILSLFFLERTKRKSAEALNDNNEALKKVNDLDAKVKANNELLKVEEVNRKQQVEALEKAKNEELSAKNLVDFFNRRK